MKPVARRTGLVVRELPDEVVVYDLERHEAHCLNRTAAMVFRSADGCRTVADIAGILGAETNTPPDEAVVGMAIGELVEARLLEPAVEPIPTLASSRREALRRVGLGAAVLLPLITSVLVPTPSEAAATCVSSCAGQPPGQQCCGGGALGCPGDCSNPACVCDGAGTCGPC